MSTRIIALADKTVVSVVGLEVHGLKPNALEGVLQERTGRIVRVIGVTGDSVQMDVYGLAPEDVLRDEQGIIRAVSAVEGIRATEIASILSAHRPRELTLDDLRQGDHRGCPGERWMRPPATND